MLELSAALALFVGAHAAPRAFGWRDPLRRALGAAGYGAAYSLVSLASLFWVFSAAGRAPFTPLWDGGRAAALAVLIATPLALYLIVSGVSRPNPLGLSLAGAEADWARPGAAAFLRDPALAGFGLWAAAHLLANGDAAHAFLFGSCLLLALGGGAVVQARARRTLGPAGWAAADAARRSGARAALRRGPSARSVGEIVLAAALSVLMVALHPALFGVSPLGWL